MVTPISLGLLSVILTALVVVYLVFARKESEWADITAEYSHDYQNYDYQHAKTQRHKYLLLKSATAILSLLDAVVLVYIFINIVNR